MSTTHTLLVDYDTPFHKITRRTLSSLSEANRSHVSVKLHAYTITRCNRVHLLVQSIVRAKTNQEQFPQQSCTSSGCRFVHILSINIVSTRPMKNEQRQPKLPNALSFIQVIRPVPQLYAMYDAIVLARCSDINLESA